MKKIILPLIIALSSRYATAQCNEAFTVPYAINVENAIVPGLPDCMDSTYFAFASNEVFESIAGPVAGFDGKLLAYDTFTGSQGGGAMMPTIGADLYTHDIHLVQGVEYVVSYRYANSDATKTIGRFGVQLQRPSASYYDDLATHLNVTGATVNNHTTPHFTVPSTGDYVLKFDVQSFEDQGLFYLDNISIRPEGTMGADEILFSGITAFPNPVADKLIVNSPNAIEKIEIYSLTGQMLCGEPVNALTHETDMGNLATGIYMLHIQSGHRIEKMKICKK